MTTEIILEPYTISLMNILGQGKFGVVYEGKHRTTNDKVAAKKCRIYGNDALKEIKYLLSLQKHPNVVHMLDFKLCSDSIWIIMEFCDGGDLNAFFRLQNRPLSTKVDIMLQCAEAIHFMHGLKKPMVHRDIKPANILLMHRDTNVIVKLADFGISTAADVSTLENTFTFESACGTPEFWAPEIVDKKSSQKGLRHFDKKVDVFALGLVYFSLINHKSSNIWLAPPVFDAEMYTGQYMLFCFKHKIAMPTFVEENEFDRRPMRIIKQLIKRMTQYKPLQRADMEEVKNVVLQVAQMLQLSKNDGMEETRASVYKSFLRRPDDGNDSSNITRSPPHVASEDDTDRSANALTCPSPNVSIRESSSSTTNTESVSINVGCNIASTSTNDASLEYQNLLLSIAEGSQDKRDRTDGTESNMSTDRSREVPVHSTDAGTSMSELSSETESYSQVNTVVLPGRHPSTENLDYQYPKPSLDQKTHPREIARSAHKRVSLATELSYLNISSDLSNPNKVYVDRSPQNHRTGHQSGATNLESNECDTILTEPLPYIYSPITSVQDSPQVHPRVYVQQDRYRRELPPFRYGWPPEAAVQSSFGDVHYFPGCQVWVVPHPDMQRNVNPFVNPNDPSHFREPQVPPNTPNLPHPSRPVQGNTPDAPIDTQCDTYNVRRENHQSPEVQESKLREVNQHLHDSVGGLSEVKQHVHESRLSEAHVDLYRPRTNRKSGQGLCVIITNFTGDLPGYRVDTQVITSFFEDTLGYQVFGGSNEPNIAKFNNVNREEFIATLSEVQNYLNQPLSYFDRFVMFVLSHGNQTGIKMCADEHGYTEESDVTVEVQDIVDMFTHDKVPSMRGLPKCFFLFNLY